MAAVPATLMPSLRGLNDMLRQFWPEQAGIGIPLAFWEIEDDDLLIDAFQYLPTNVRARGGRTGLGHTDAEIETLPEGFRLLVTLFDLEDAFAGEGWAGLANIGDEGMRNVIAACETLGLTTRAEALRRVWTAFEADPDDEDALRAAAGDALPDVIDDEEACQRLAAYVRADPGTRFGTIPDDA